MAQIPSDFRQFSSLLHIVKALRGPQGCPWDLQQTHQTLTRYALEEAAEYVQAVELGDKKEMCSELGDMLFQVVLNSEIAQQEGNFNINDVIESICHKMVRRHPHVFGQTQVQSTQEVIANWQKIKEEERKSKNLGPLLSFFEGISPHLPAFLVSQKLGEKTQLHNFDWQKVQDVLGHLEEELKEFKQALEGESLARQLEELGDMAFCLAQLARHLNGDAEHELRQANLRFVDRFRKMMEFISEAGLDIHQLSEADRETFWQRAKLMMK